GLPPRLINSRRSGNPFEGGDQLFAQRSRRGRILAGDQAAINDDVGLPVGCRGVLGPLRPQRVLEFVGYVLAGVVVLLLLRERRELPAAHERRAIAEVDAEQRARTMTNRAHEL